MESFKVCLLTATIVVCAMWYSDREFVTWEVKANGYSVGVSNSLWDCLRLKGNLNKINVEVECSINIPLDDAKEHIVELRDIARSFK